MKRGSASRTQLVVGLLALLFTAGCAAQPASPSATSSPQASQTATSSAPSPVASGGDRIHDSIIREISPSPSPLAGGVPTAQELVFARDLAKQEIASQTATGVTAFLSIYSGTVSQPNLDYSCAPGRLLQVLLIGQFPHIVVSGIGAAEVSAVEMTADAGTGQACLLGVRTGAVSAPLGSVPLSLG